MFYGRMGEEGRRGRRDDRGGEEERKGGEGIEQLKVHVYNVMQSCKQGNIQ